MNSIFSCQSCKHAILENDSQKDCNLNLLETLPVVGELNGYYELGRVCLSKSEIPDVNLGYIFVLKDDSLVDLMFENIEKIKDKNPLWIGINSDFIGKSEIILNRLQSIISCKFNIISNYDPISDFDRLDQFMKNYKNGWTLVNVVGEEFNPDSKDVLQKYIIDNAGIAGLIKNNENINGWCFFNMIYKYLKGSIPEIEKDTEIITTDTFLEKIEKQQKSMIKNWGDIQ